MLTLFLRRINVKALLPFFTTLLFLAGCSLLSSSDELAKDANSSSEFYLNQANQTQSSNDKLNYQLLAVRVLLTENKTAQAEALLAELTGLSSSQQLDKSILEAQIAVNKQQNQQASSLLNAINVSSLSPSQQARYYLVVAKVAESNGNIIEAVQAHINIVQILTDTQRKQANIDETWALLRNANKGLISSTQPQGNLELAGWLALAQAYNNNTNQPEQLQNVIQNWRNAYPNHPAAYLFPTELKNIFGFQQTQTRHIALLLPLSDSAQVVGNIVRTGFLDAKGASPVTVTVYDTVKTPIETIIQQAKQKSVDAIVGPLLKADVDALVNNSAEIQGINVLALNSTSSARALPQVCYYGLSPEDEARSAANKIWNDGIRTPWVIVPQNDLGQRSASAFSSRWQQLAATDANIRFYNQPDDILYALQDNLANNQTDTAALYIVASSEQLRDIKNTVNNSNNHNVKFYASSRSNSSNNGPEYRVALEGLEFSDIPFLVNADSQQFSKVVSATNGDYSLMRLYAMGSDAWALINHFNELKQVPGYNISGLTGGLSAGPNCDIERNLSWLQYSGGSIRVLN